MNPAAVVLRVGIAITMIAFGYDQYRHPKDWKGFIPPWYNRTMPFGIRQDLLLISAGNMFLGGFLIFGIFPFVMSCLVLGWWLTLLPYSFHVKWTIGMRDFSIVLALITLVLITGGFGTA